MRHTILRECIVRASTEQYRLTFDQLEVNGMEPIYSVTLHNDLHGQKVGLGHTAFKEAGIQRYLHWQRSFDAVIIPGKSAEGSTILHLVP